MEQTDILDLNRTEIIDGKASIQVGDRCPYLVIFIGEDGGKRHKLKSGKMTIGRSPKADITINDQRVSRIHCVIEWDGETIFIEDNGSTNGIYVDSNKVSHAPLPPGVSIQLGQSVMKIEYKDDAEIQAEETLMRKVSVDPLTGIFSRQHFLELAAMEMAYACRHQLVVGIIMLNIDNLYNLINAYDPQTGDFVLTRIAALVHKTIRTEDLFARYTEDEFIIMPRGVPTKKDMHTQCERIRQAVENKKFRFGEDRIKVTCSLGFHLEKVSGREYNEKLSDMVTQASRALYLANDNGGNRSQSLI
jgi:diguanylate cyclase (GGDEF)-like protein